MTWKTWATAVGIGAVLAVVHPEPSAYAFDRRDGSSNSGVITDPSTDIVDLFAWMQSLDAKRVNLIMTVNPDAGATSLFSQTALYVFHIRARQSLTDTSPAPEFQVICRFSGMAMPQTFECWAGKDEYVKGATGGSYKSSKTGNLSVFAGLRNDPFFINDDGTTTGTGMTAALATIATTFKAKTRDAAGCYAFSATEQTTLRTKLATPANRDSYKGKNVLAIIITMDTSLVTVSGKPILTVWGSTNKPL